MKKIIGFFFFGLGFLILLSLGLWQIERLQWKTGIMAQLDTLYASDPMENRINYNDLTGSQSMLYGYVQGTLESEKTILLKPKTYKGKIGSHVITPFKLTSGEYILVNQGWLPEEAEATPPTIRTMQLPGILRKPQDNQFTPENSPYDNIWNQINITQMAYHWRMGDTPVSPMVLYATAPISSEITPIFNKWYPRNKHKAYAIFWFSMAFIYCVIFVAANRQKKAEKA